MPGKSTFSFAFLMLSLGCLTVVYGQPVTRPVQIQTDQITRSDVAISPDGDWLVLTSLGHLFRLPASGGELTQLTFGPWFDSEPAVSPDGRHIVFASDRGGKTNGNLFLLKVESGELRQLTDDEWATRPSWSPNGDNIVYLSYERQGMWSEYEFVAANGVLSHVKVMPVEGGESTTLTKAPGLIRSAFYLTDGRVGWTVLGGPAGESQAHDLGIPVSRIMAVNPQGAISTLLSIDGVVDRVVPSGNDLYVRRYQISVPIVAVPQPEDLAVVSRSGEIRTITSLMNPHPRPGFAVANDSIYLGERGQLFRIDVESGDRQTIPFTASIQMEVLGRADAVKYEPENPTMGTSTSVLDPRLSPDGRNLYFTAAGFIWRQSLDGGIAQRINSDDGFQWGAAAVSPDDSQIAYQHSEGNLQELRIANVNDGTVRTLVTVDRSGRFEPAWSPDGKKIVYVGFAGMVPSLYTVDVDTGQRSKVVDSFPRWMPRPQFASDGDSVYYTDRNQVRRISLEEGSAPEAITDFRSVHVGDGTISADGKWLAYRKNDEIWVARLDRGPVTEESAQKLTDDGGWNFSFSPDSRALIYSSGSAVWRHPLSRGRQTEITVNLSYPDHKTPPTLIRNVRVLDFDVGGFSNSVSMLVNNGRIQWLGSEAGKTIPDDARTLEAGGRYAIPGLFDSHTHVATPIHFNPARDVSRMSSNLAFGITSVRDMGSDLTLVKAWEDRRKNYGAPVPRIFSGGAMVEAGGPFFHGGSQFATTEAEARQIVRKEASDGAIAIKPYFTLPWSLHRAIADEALELGIPVTAHGLIFRETVMDPVLGRTTIEHQPTPIRLYDDVLQLLAKTGTKWCPTFTATGGNGILFAQQPYLLSDPKLRAFTSQSDYALAEEVEMFSMLDPQALGRTYADLLASIGQGHATGVELLTGTDALNPNVFYGHGQQMEMRHFARARIPPIEILRLATIGSAATVGADAELGTLEPGKLADIVILNSNPLQDITNAMDIWHVMQEGRLFTSMAEAAY